MAEILLRPAAWQDLEDIWNYSDYQWGEKRADAYIRQLNEGFLLLADAPETGRDCSDIRPGYRKYQVARHVIFYRITSDGDIEIVRILHERMDVERHLPE
jgi:toxin ParE1/3/4